MGSPRAKKRPEREGRSPFSYLGLGFEIAIPILLGAYGGYHLDRWLGTGPWLFVVGALLGMALGFYGFFKAVQPPRGSS